MAGPGFEKRGGAKVGVYECFEMAMLVPLAESHVHLPRGRFPWGAEIVFLRLELEERPSIILGTVEPL